MNCRDAEPLLLAERDGVLTSEQQAALVQHLAVCPDCRHRHTTLAAAMDAMRADAAQVKVPDAGTEWRALQAQLGRAPIKPAKKRPLAPVIWFSAPLAIAAAVAIAFLVGRPFFVPAEAGVSVAETARAEYVEVEDSSASTMVYVDKDSGWLVVWAVDGATKNSG